jgi:F0F1-type ATP synthase alpha subunit
VDGNQALENNQEHQSAKFQVHEIGMIIAVRECIVRVQGMPSCINGQIVERGRRQRHGNGF